MIADATSKVQESVSTADLVTDRTVPEDAAQMLAATAEKVDAAVGVMQAAHQETRRCEDEAAQALRGRSPDPLCRCSRVFGTGSPKRAASPRPPRSTARRPAAAASRSDPARETDQGWRWRRSCRRPGPSGGQLPTRPRPRGVRGPTSHREADPGASRRLSSGPVGRSPKDQRPPAAKPPLRREALR